MESYIELVFRLQMPCPSKGHWRGEGYKRQMVSVSALSSGTQTGQWKEQRCGPKVAKIKFRHLFSDVSSDLFLFNQRLWQVSYRERFRSPWTCVLTQFVFPPLSHMTCCILWNQTCYLRFNFRMFSAICECVHGTAWWLIRFLLLHSRPVWHDSQGRCLGSTQGIGEINSRIKLNVI